MTKRTGRFLVLGLVLVGCDASSVILPEVTADCRRQSVEAVLHLDAGDPRQIWATRLEDDAILVVRPRSDLGWRLDSGPPTRLLDADGRVAAREGDILRSVCFDVIMGTYFIGPEDLPSPDRPPN
jgi:hypothetical protein